MVDDFIEYLRAEYVEWKNFKCYSSDDATAKSTALGTLHLINGKIIELKANMEKSNDR